MNEKISVLQKIGDIYTKFWHYFNLILFKVTIASLIVIAIVEIIERI